MFDIPDGGTVDQELNAIAVDVENRKWMRAAKAWRIFLDLPKDNIVLPSVLTGMIDRQFKVEIKNAKGTVTIDPAIIVDVPPKGKGFQLVVETCYEHQNGIGPFLTAMHKESAILSIYKAHSTPQPAVGSTRSSQPQPQERPERNKDLIKGLHVLFGNVRFQSFIQAECDKISPYSVLVCDAASCKAAFKSMAGVESTKDLTDEYINDYRSRFNDWINGR